MNELSLLDTLFDTACGLAFPSLDAPVLCPKADVVSTKDNYKITMDLPGVSLENIAITVKDNNMTVASSAIKAGKEEAKDGEKEESKADKPEETFLIRERFACDFSRSFKLPQNADTANITASYKDGVLTVTIGKKAEAQELRITVNAA